MNCTRCKKEEAIEGGRWGETCRAKRRRYLDTGTSVKKRSLITRTRTTNDSLRLKEHLILTAPVRSCECCGERKIQFLHVCSPGSKAIGHSTTLSKIKRENIAVKVLCANCEKSRTSYGRCAGGMKHNRDLVRLGS